MDVLKTVLATSFSLPDAIHVLTRCSVASMVCENEAVVQSKSGSGKLELNMYVVSHCVDASICKP